MRRLVLKDDVSQGNTYRRRLRLNMHLRLNGDVVMIRSRAQTLSIKPMLTFPLYGVIDNCYFSQDETDSSPIIDALLISSWKKTTQQTIILREFNDVFAIWHRLKSRNWFGVFLYSNTYNRCDWNFPPSPRTQSHRSLPHHRIFRVQNKKRREFCLRMLFADALKYFYFLTSSAVAKLRLID